MTTADKVRIDGLLNEVETMRTVSEKMTKPYHDEKIAEYCAKALAEYNEIRDYITGKVNEHIELFFDHDCMKIGQLGSIASFGGTLHENDVERELFGSFQVLFSMIPSMCHCVRLWNGNYEYKCSNGGICVKSVGIYNYDTHTREYRISVADTLDKCKFRPCDYDKLTFTATDWDIMYNRAKLTREKSQLLLSAFEKALRERLMLFSAKANEQELSRKSNGKVGEYISVRSV